MCMCVGWMSREEGEVGVGRRDEKREGKSMEGRLYINKTCIFLYVGVGVYVYVNGSETREEDL